jgi:uncharacterized protein YigE (DUF2233 family)
MRCFLFAFQLFVFACFTTAGSAQWALTSRSAKTATPGIDFAEVQVTNAEGAKAELHIVAFQHSRFTLAVIDDASGDKTLASAAEARGAVAAVNGGYFHPDRKPLGLVISGGKTLQGIQKAKLLSGIVSATPKGISLRRVGEVKGTAGIRDALQAGPFLVDNGKAVTGLNASRSAARTVVCTMSDGRTALVVCHSPTLAETAQILLTPGILPHGGKITRALNLDGGSSTGLWVKRDSSPFYFREFKDVRNYLAVVPKK